MQKTFIVDTNVLIQAPQALLSFDNNEVVLPLVVLVSKDILQIDENICSMYEYFEIFLGRMVMCRRAAEILGSQFRLTVNGNKVL